jgi:putative transposase
MPAAKRYRSLLSGSLNALACLGPCAATTGVPLPVAKRCTGLSRLSAWWLALGIDLERGRPGHPQDNGAHERLHRDISLQLQSLGQSDQNSLDLWREEFNHQRPHEALQMRCPAELYHNSPRKYQGGLEQLAYPQMDPRRVNQCGQIRWHNQEFFISSSLAGWSVGLKLSPEQQIEVWFARLLLGWIEPTTASFFRADIGPKKTKNNTTKL